FLARIQRLLDCLRVKSAPVAFRAELTHVENVRILRRTGGKRQRQREQYNKNLHDFLGATWPKPITPHTPLWTYSGSGRVLRPQSTAASGAARKDSASRFSQSPPRASSTHPDSARLFLPPP